MKTTRSETVSKLFQNLKKNEQKNTPKNSTTTKTISSHKSIQSRPVFQCKSKNAVASLFALSFLLNNNKKMIEMRMMQHFMRLEFGASIYQIGVKQGN
jgi:hypothetical protein